MDEIVRTLHESGDDLRQMSEHYLPDYNPEYEVEDIWSRTLTGQKDFNAVIIGEEGTFEVQDDPDYAFLIDPIDGTSGALNGEFPWVTTSVGVLEDVDVNGERVTGKPVGAYIGQFANDTDLLAWDNEAWIDGKVRYTEIDTDDELPGEVDDIYIGPRRINSFDQLDEQRKGMVSAYAAKPSRRPVREHFLGPLEDLDPRVRIAVAGGSYTGASVGWGKHLVTGEPKPTFPTETAGEIFARAMGASTANIFGEQDEIVAVENGEYGPERSVNTVIAANDDILEETLEAIDQEALEEAYPEEFETYQRFRV